MSAWDRPPLTRRELRERERRAAREAAERDGSADADPTAVGPVDGGPAGAGSAGPEGTEAGAEGRVPIRPGHGRRVLRQAEESSGDGEAGHEGLAQAADEAQPGSMAPADDKTRRGGTAHVSDAVQPGGGVRPSAGLLSRPAANRPDTTGPAAPGGQAPPDVSQAGIVTRSARRIAVPERRESGASAPGGAAWSGIDRRRQAGADLPGADLPGADLPGADAYGAERHGTDVRSADVRSADVRSNSTDVRSTDVHGADVRSTGLHGTSGRDAQRHGGTDGHGTDRAGRPDAVRHGVAAAGSSSTIVLPELPRVPDVTGPLTAAGEVLVTGTIDLPASLAETGEHPRNVYRPDGAVDGGDDPEAAYHPVSAAHAVGAYAASHNAVTPEVKRESRLVKALPLIAGGMALVVVALVVAGFVFHVF